MSDKINLKSEFLLENVWPFKIFHFAPWVENGHMLADKRRDEVLGPEVDNTCIFWVGFIAFTDHKITCCKVITLHDIDTMGNSSTCNFSKKFFLNFFSSLSKQFFLLFLCNVSCFCFALSSNLCFYLAIFFHRLQYFMKFSRWNGLVWDCLLQNFSNFAWANSWIQVNPWVLKLITLKNLKSVL